MAGITIKGMDELNRKLGRIGRDIRPELRRTTDRAVKYVHGTIPSYPAPPATSTYRRTGTLGRANTTEVREIGNEIVGVIGNNTVYAPWVISKEEAAGAGPQAKVHQGRWYTLQQVVADAKAAVIGLYEQMVRDLLNS